MQNEVGKGTIVLIVSGIICKLLGAFFRLPLTSILGMQGIGVFQMVMCVYSFTLVLTSSGVTTALSKFVSQARARGDYGKIKMLLFKSLSFTLIFGSACGLAIMLFSGQIASLQGAAEGGESYKLMLLLIPFGGVIASFRGIFQGYEKMAPTAISQILEQSTKFLLGLLFAHFFAKKSLSLGVFGAFLGVTAGEIVASLFLVLYFHFKTKLPSAKQLAYPFLGAVIPLSLASSVLPLVSTVDSFVVVSRLNVAGIESSFATSLFGLETGVVGAILNFPLILSSALSTAILPSLSFSEAKLSEEGDKSIASSLKVMWLVLLPLVFGIAAICRPLYSLVYPSLDSTLLDYAVKLTYFGCVSTIITALMQFFVAILESRGHFYFCMLSYLLGGLAKIACVIGLCSIRSINIFGVVIGNIALSSVVCIMALVKNKRKISVGFFDLALPLVSAFAMTLTVLTVLNKLAFSNIFKLILGIAIGGVVYLFCTLPITSEIAKQVLKSRRKSQNSSSTEV